MKNSVLYRINGTLKVTFIVVVAVLCSVAIVSAATTISTNIVTEGNTTLGDAVADSVTANAYFTQLRIGTGSTFGNIGTVGADELGVEGDVEIDGTAYFDGLGRFFAGASTTNLTLLNGEVISNATDGVVQIAATASTTGITLLNGETITNTTDGTIALTGAATISSTLSVTSLATFLGGATTTTLTLLNGEVISNATDGVIQLGGIASSTSITLLNGETIANATDGTIAVTATNVTFSGAASSTTFRVGSDQISTISGLIFGYCNIATVTVNATSTAYQDCTGATGVTSSYRVFLQATSSLPAGLHIEAASSTATTGTINVRIGNSTAGANTATGAISFNFWAVR